MAELRIPIIGEFKGKKAFDDAERSTGKLDDSVKKLGKALIAAFSIQKITQFSKATVKAFVEDEAAASRLAQSVKNLGLAFETQAIETFIDQLSRASGITDDQLRPAMQRLLQTTGSLAKSTELLNLALEVSRGSGVDYETVVNDLSMAYVGQTRGLRKYSLGLTQAELKTASFAEVQEKLNKTFTGANAAYLDTYAGKLTLIQTAAGEAQETIGKGLVDAFSILATDTGSITELTEAMNSFAEGTATAFRNVAVLVSNLDKSMQAGMGLVGVLDRITGSNFVKIFGGAIGALSTQGAGTFSSFTTPGMGGYPSSALGGTYVDPNQAARKRAEAEAVKRAKALAAMQKKTLDTQKKTLENQRKQNALTKASQTLDLERISIAAALQGQISETDRLSLSLQLALLNKNDAVATKLAAELEAAIKRQNMLAAALAATPEAPNPYRNWTIPQDLLAYTAASLGVSPETVINAPQTIPAQTTDATQELLAALLAAEAAQRSADMAQAQAAAVAAGSSATPIIVNVEVAGEEVAAVITQQQTNQSLSGSFVNVNRLGRFANVPVAI
jgi:hypothetical protein